MKKKAQFLTLKELLLTSRFPAQGFTMLEVLAALMISFAFLMGALNGITMAVWMQVKAERQAQANYWIQQDLENVKSLAATQATDTTKCTSVFSTSYAGALQTQIQSVIVGSSISYITSGNTVTTTSTSPLVNKSYQLVRITRESNTIPSTPQLLTITYTVQELNDSTRTLATLYTEIIPAPAMACP